MSEQPTLAEIAAFRSFNDLFRSWRIADAGLATTAPTEEWAAWEAEEVARRDIARAVVLYRSPRLDCLRDKLDVLIRVASSAGDEMDPDDRLVLEGLCALRADLVALGG